MVHVDALPASDGVHADDGVNGLDGVAADGQARSTSTVGLSDSAVQRSQALEVLLEARAQGRVDGVSIDVVSSS